MKRMENLGRIDILSIRSGVDGERGDVNCRFFMVGLPMPRHIYVYEIEGRSNTLDSLPD